jgi:hypothetical protein
MSPYILKLINNYGNSGRISYKALECFRPEDLYAAVKYARDSKYRKNEYAHECNRFLNTDSYHNTVKFLRKKRF